MKWPPSAKTFWFKVVQLLAIARVSDFWSLKCYHEAVLMIRNFRISNQLLLFSPSTPCYITHVLETLYLESKLLLCTFSQPWKWVVKKSQTQSQKILALNEKNKNVYLISEALNRSHKVIPMFFTSYQICAKKNWPSRQQTLCPSTQRRSLLRNERNVVAMISVVNATNGMLEVVRR